MQQGKIFRAVIVVTSLVCVMAMPSIAEAAPALSDDEIITVDTFDYRPLATAGGSGMYQAQPRRSSEPTLQSLREETEQATASYQSNYPKPEVSTLDWSPPPFAYDFITPAECEDRQDASGTAQGWIKNHYAFCRIYRAERVQERCRFLFGCVTYRAAFWVTTVGFGSERERRIRFLTVVSNIQVTTQVGGFPAEPSPVLEQATLVSVQNLCAPLIRPEDCQLLNNSTSQDAATKPLTFWRGTNFFYTDMLSTAPGATDFNPDRLGYADFWNKVSIRWPLSSTTSDRESDRQTTRFDTTTYLNLNGNNGGIFSRVRPIIHFPVNDPYWAPMRLSAEHYQLAMTQPENTIPLVIGKQIPGIEGGVPLTRLYRDLARRLENRATAVAACVEQWGPDYAEGGYQCDEFPFASTREGASATHNPQRWFSVQLLPGPDNEASGRWLGAWYSYDRILDGDIFNVKVIL